MDWRNRQALVTHVLIAGILTPASAMLIEFLGRGDYTNAFGVGAFFISGAFLLVLRGYKNPVVLEKVIPNE